MRAIRTTQPMETDGMTLDTARAILGLTSVPEGTSFAGHEEAERVAFERHMANLRSRSWAPLSAMTNAIAVRRGRWS